VAVTLKLVTILQVQHICMAQRKADLAVSLPSNEESAAVQSEAAHTNRAKEAEAV